MKCPNCGFVTFPDPAECKKCGHRFAVEVRRPPQTARSVTFRSPERSFSLSAPEPPRLKLVPHEPEITPKAEGASDPVEPETPIESGQPVAREIQDKDSAITQADAANAWQEEIAARVAGYKRRRGRTDEPEVADGSLRFEFDALDRPGGAAKATVAAETELKPRKRVSELEFDLDGSSEFSQADENLDPQRASPPHEDAVEWALEPLDFQASEHPVEVVLHSGGPEADAQESHHDALRVAPLGRRFAAGMLDILVLLIAGTVFFMLFRTSGGHVDRQPADLAIVGFAAAFLVTFYFSAFTALAFATPGQSAVGLQVQTFDGETPNVRASVWRGTGYLVSAILMLGFAWAALDPEQLTWHDRMSRTCLVERG